MNNRMPNFTALAIALLAVLSMAAVCVTSGGKVETRSDRFPIADGARIEIDADIAEISIRTRISSEIIVKAELRNAELISYTVSVSDGAPPGLVNIRAKAAPNLRNRTSASIVVIAPPDAHIVIRNGSGDVSVSGDRESATRVEVGDGNITITGSAVSYDLEANRGDIRVTDVTDSVNARTRSGAIHVEGDLAEGSHSSLSAGFGDIELSLGKRSSVKLTGGVDHGRIEADAPIVLDSDGKSLSGVIGAGEGEVEIRVASGTIRFRSRS